METHKLWNFNYNLYFVNNNSKFDYYNYFLFYRDTLIMGLERHKSMSILYLLILLK